MEKEKLRALQYVQMSIMEDIHRVCVENNLRYYLIGGSALGAIRHKGFIPWDVDIDIAMPRPDYDAFVDVFSKELKPRLTCLSYKTIKKWWCPHAVVIMKDSIIIDKNGSRQTDLRPSEIFVDILPLDICPEREKQQKRQASRLLFVRNIKNWKAAWSSKKDGAMKRFYKSILKLALSPFSWTLLNSWQHRIMTKYNETSKSGLWCSMVSHYGYKKLMMPATVFGTPTLADFENTQFYVPEQVIDYLTRIFGNYMRLPSESEQQAQMNVFVDAQW